MPAKSSTIEKIPVTVLTGFLGSGKTTLLNRILSEEHGQRIAVIENEFGEIGIDHALVINADEEIFEMNNGCICCTVRGDLIRILGNLVKRRDKFDRIIVETTGMADPGPVAQTFFVDEDINRQFVLDGVVTLVDARHAMLHLDESEECQQQIAFGDVILLNKTDLATQAQLDALEVRLRLMNPLAKIIRTHNAAAPINEVLEVGGFDLDHALARKPEFLAPEYPFEWGGIFALNGGEQVLLQEGPDARMKIALLPVTDATADALAVAAEALVRFWSSASVTASNTQVMDLDLRAAGLKTIDLQPGGCGLYAIFTQHLPEEFAAEWRDGAGAVLEPIVVQAYAAGHSHDDSVGSVGIRASGPVNPDAFNRWLSALLQANGADIFRSKGILNFAGQELRYVFQGVHMLIDGYLERPWPPGPRENQLVFIGRKLDREMLEIGFRRCLA